FPGPGLAIRVLGEVTTDRLDIVREADAVVQDEVRAAGLEPELWQAFAVLLPIRTVGVMGGFRTYANVVALRAVLNQDAMTPDRLPEPHQAGLAGVPRGLLLQAPGRPRAAGAARRRVAGALRVPELRGLTEPERWRRRAGAGDRGVAPGGLR